MEKRMNTRAAKSGFAWSALVAICLLMVGCLLLMTSCNGDKAAMEQLQAAQQSSSTAAGSSAASAAGTYQHLSGKEVQELLKSDPNALLVDVRQPLAYQFEHIDGAINVPQDVIAKSAESELPDKDQVIVLYCDYGGVSKIAAEDLVEKGYTNIIEFDGLEDWPGETVKG